MEDTVRPPVEQFVLDPSNRDNSWVQDLNSVTILWLRCFDDWFDLYGPFI